MTDCCSLGQVGGLLTLSHGCCCRPKPTSQLANLSIGREINSCQLPIAAHLVKLVKLSWVTVCYAKRRQSSRSESSTVAPGCKGRARLQLSTCCCCCFCCCLLGWLDQQVQPAVTSHCLPWVLNRWQVRPPGSSQWHWSGIRHLTIVGKKVGT